MPRRSRSVALAALAATLLTVTARAQEAAAPAGPPAPKRLAVGATGYFQPSVTLQGWLFARSADPVDAPADSALTFRLRRAELKAKGELIPSRIAYAVMVDPAKTLKFGSATVAVQNQDPAPSDPLAPEQVTVPTPPANTSILQDLSVTLLTDFADVSFGQFKVPVSLEGSGSSSKLLFPERALASSAFGDRRDIGLKAEKTFSRFGYVVGVFNGSGQNRIDDNLQKDLALRVEAYPLQGVMLGAVGYLGVGERDEPETRDRVEGDLRVTLADALLQIEYLHGWDGTAGDRTEAHGAYAMAGYTVAERIQPMLRLGFLDEDVREPDTITRHYEIGVNYYVQQQELKLQAAYAHFNTDLDASESSDRPNRHEATLALQLCF